MVGHGYEAVGCGWVGDGNAVLCGGRCERSLVGESTGDDNNALARLKLTSKLFSAKSTKTDLKRSRKNKNKSVPEVLQTTRS